VDNIWHSVSQLEESNGELLIDGCPARDLVEKYGSPLYVYSENRIRDNTRRLIQAYKKYYPHFSLYYAVKANNHPAVVKILAEEGAGADCSCVGELDIASLVGIAANKQLFSPVFPSQESLAEALSKNVLINLENIEDLNHLARFGMPEFLSFRVNPGVGSSGSEGLVFAGKDAKFGIVESQVEEAYAKAKELGVRHFGVHMMTGSNILSPPYFKEIVARLLDIVGPIAQKLGIQFEFIDIGGSLGIPYKPEQSDLDIDAVAREVVETFKDRLVKYEMGEPALIHEPGRYLVADAGILLTSVVSKKKTHKTFIGVDAGMNTLLRPALYDTYHHILCANKLDAPCDKEVNVVGPICENTDQFAKDRLLPSKLEVGDLLALLDVGAYGFSMSSQYNTQPRAAEVLVCSGESHLIRKRETLNDILKTATIPKHLSNKIDKNLNLCDQ
jgi:diaminopimelate decarboxylase